jgi:hypothetical protein
MLQPFFCMYGGKHRLAARLGPPQRTHVVEPFAGSAGYSCFWQPPQITLVEKDPLIAGIWHYLTHATSREVLALPIVDDVSELPPSVPQEARALIGFWFNHGINRPGTRRSRWARTPRHRASFWSESIRLRLAVQVEAIRHWRVIEGDYTIATNRDAHWHVDPPYQIGGRGYALHDIDYGQLALWCRTRKGFVQVCENTGADWLPFEEYALLSDRHRSGIASEAVFECENPTVPVAREVRTSPQHPRQDRRQDHGEPARNDHARQASRTPRKVPAPTPANFGFKTRAESAPSIG